MASCQFYDEQELLMVKTDFPHFNDRKNNLRQKNRNFKFF